MIYGHLRVSDPPKYSWWKWKYKTFRGKPTLPRLFLYLIADFGLKRLPDYLKYKLECSRFATFYTLSYITKKPRVCSCGKKNLFVSKTWSHELCLLTLLTNVRYSTYSRTSRHSTYSTYSTYIYIYIGRAYYHNFTTGEASYAVPRSPGEPGG